MKHQMSVISHVADNGHLIKHIQVQSNTLYLPLHRISFYMRKRLCHRRDADDNKRHNRFRHDIRSLIAHLVGQRTHALGGVGCY